ncbi:hypothetical protein BDN70DRAFT_156733 [Pholiota conissans]|uniref:Uncharacterized protein n=1 Tax=Pholiota conissans TaxID=109636 RepID=A0A9P6CXU7_9AGAR|nr:hypothetical protein BDN70DRAFT_156733 [Pholiota conissans]
MALPRFRFSVFPILARPFACPYRFCAVYSFGMYGLLFIVCFSFDSVSFFRHVISLCRFGHTYGGFSWRRLHRGTRRAARYERCVLVLSFPLSINFLFLSQSLPSCSNLALSSNPRINFTDSLFHTSISPNPHPSIHPSINPFPIPSIVP